jgi:hypothetical protein
MTRALRIAIPLLGAIWVLAGPVAANDPKSPIDILAEAIAPCWHIDHGADWSETSVTVAFDISPERKPITTSIQVVGDNGGPSADIAFQAARRAIVRCGSQGFALAPGDYETWRSVEITFDPRN